MKGMSGGGMVEGGQQFQEGDIFSNEIFIFCHGKMLRKGFCAKLIEPAPQRESRFKTKIAFSFLFRFSFQPPCAGILEQSMGARGRGPAGYIGLRNRFLGCIKV